MKTLLNELINKKVIGTETVYKAMESVDRADFVEVSNPYADW
jgi:hypothetical protein